MRIEPLDHPRTHATAIGIGGALVAGMGLMTLGIAVESFGYVAVLGMPVVVGFLVGHLCATPAAASTLISSGLLLVALSGIFFGGGGGILCTTIAAALLLLPTAVGALLGQTLRRRAPFRVRARTGALLVLAVAVGLPLEARLTPPHQPEAIRTSAIVDAAPEEAFDAIVFYESLPFARPLLARVFLPRPVGVTGDADRVGAAMKCLYEKGHVEKLVTERRRGERFAFAIIEQVGIEDRSAELLGGSFEFAPTPDGRTRVTVQSTYRPKLDARPLWRPFERLVCRGMHRQVLEGVRCQIERDEGRRDATPPSRLELQ
jgi:hypothetical protein